MESLVKKLLIINILGLVLVKAVLVFSSYQLADISAISLFNSRDIVSVTNDVRIKNGFHVLVPNSKLDLAAADKLQDMDKKGYFAHISPDGISPWFWIDKNNYNYIYAGENLAMNFNNAESAVTAWLNSPSHRANILNKNYTDIGVAVGKANIAGSTTTVVVQIFGRAGGSSVPARKMPKQTSLPAKPTPLPSRPPQLVAGDRDSSLKDPVKLNQVSTDSRIEPVSGALKVSISGQPFSKLSQAVSNTYIVYSFVAAVFTLLVFLAIERTRKNLTFAVLNTVVFAAAVILPAVKLANTGLIF